MCGIAGFTIAPGDRAGINTQAMTRVLGYEMMTRGTDATGVLTVDFKGRWKVRKKDLPAHLFLAGRAGLGRNAQTSLIHTRAATQGRPEDMGNNHPIIHGSIVGIHNGIVYNDDELFAHYKWPRLAKVDSEAIFAALNYLPQDEALTNIDAGWAIAWINTDDDPRKMWLARGWSSPLHYALTQNGTVVFASTASAVKDAMKWGNITGDPDVKAAPEGFLAHTDPDNGGLIIMPSFDGSGKTAIGVRKPSQYAYYGSGWEDGSWRAASGQRTASIGTPALPAGPKPYERITMSGDVNNPKVGDRRKYLSQSGTWLFEICTVAPAEGATKHTAKWDILIGYGTANERTVNGPVEPLDETVLDELEIIQDARQEQLWDDDEFKYGFGRVGDWIAIKKSMFDGGEGELLGQVISEDKTTGDLFVDFRTTRIAYDAYYEVLNPASFREENNEVSA